MSSLFLAPYCESCLGLLQQHLHLSQRAPYLLILTLTLCKVFNVLSSSFLSDSLHYVGAAQKDELLQPETHKLQEALLEADALHQQGKC